MIRARDRLLPALVVFALLILPIAARAATLHVDPVLGPYYTIQSAIDAAQPEDVVELAPSTYQESLVIEDKILSVVSLDGPETTILDGSGRFRLVSAQRGRLHLDGLTFSNGKPWVGGGGAIRAHETDLTVTSCDFRNNEVTADGRRTLGGAIYVSGVENPVVLEGCLFVGNRAIGWPSDGGTLGFTDQDVGGDKPSPRLVDDELVHEFATEPVHEVSDEPIDERVDDDRVDEMSNDFARDVVGNERITHGAGDSLNHDPGPGRIRRERFIQVERCTFLHSSGGSAAIVSWSSPVYVSSSLFSGNEPAEVDDDNISVTCSIFWDRAPAASGRSQRPSEEESSNWDIDPRFCPNDPERLHESSPAFKYAQCGPIGGRPPGCVAPMVLGNENPVLSPENAQMVKIYAYGLDRANRVEFESPTGAIRSGHRLSHHDAWMVLELDALGAEPGFWSMRFFQGEKLLWTEENAIEVLPFTVLAFQDPWIERVGRHELKLAQHGWTADLDLALLHHDDPDERIEITGVEALSADTLLLSVDLGRSPVGPYDLEVSHGLSRFQVPFVLFYGEPALVRVPEDAPTISAALSMAPAGAEIRLASGTYSEDLVIERPVRLVGSENAPELQNVSPDRTIRVLASAGRITTFESLRFAGAHAWNGHGGGLESAVPIRILNCEFFRNVSSGLNGGGASLAPGSQVRGTAFIANGVVAPDDHVVVDPFVASSGVGGGLFCLDCRVEQCEFRGNHAHTAGAAAVTGIFRDSYLNNNLANGADGGIDEVAARGVIAGNRFEGECGIQAAPTAVFIGPSTVSFNTFSDYLWDLCGELSLIQLQGPVDFFRNTLAGARLQVCTHCSFEPPLDAAIRVYDNLIESSNAAGPWVEFCERRLGPGPVFAVPYSNLEFSCNLGDAITIFTPDQEIECAECAHAVEDLGFCEVPTYDGYYSYGDFDLRLRPTSPALPRNSPFGCEDTLGAQPVGCQVSPVLVSGARIVRTGDGVEARWTISTDVSARALRLSRERDGAKSGIAALPVCDECLYLDEEARGLSGVLRYWLTIVWESGIESEILLGEVDSASPRELLLQAPVPNPARDKGEFSFYLPQRSMVRIDLIDAAGRVRREISNGTMSAGWTRVSLDPELAELAAGVYWLRVTTNEREKRVQRLVVIR